MTADHVPPTAEALLAQSDWIRALARRLVVDPGTADDVAQDAALVALTKPPADARAVRGWLARVVTNLAHNARRGETRRGAREAAAAMPEAVPAADEVVAQWEIRRRVVEAVLALDEPYRTTILLRFFEGLTAADTAARLGVPLETARTRTRRGLELLRGRLAALDDGRGRRGVAVLLFLARDDGAGGPLAGGAVMASSTKWAVAAAAILLGLGATWAVLAGQPEDEPAAKPSAPTETATPPKPRRAERPAEATKPAGVDLAACDRERDLFGVVVDPDGKPVAGARVVVLRKRPWAATLATRDYADMLVAGEATKSAPDGTFALRLARDDGVTLRVDADGFAVWESQYRQAGERVLVRLAAALTLDVRVLTEAGAPVADAPVRVAIEPADGESSQRHAPTDAAGRARFERMPRGAKGSVDVRAKSLSLGYRAMQFADAATQTIDVTLPATRVVNGVVIDAFTKVGLAGAEVGQGHEFGAAVVTDSLGRFEIAAYPKSPIEALAAGHARGEAKVPEKGDVTIAVEPQARVVGRVVDAAGDPVKDADVALIGNSDMTFGGGSGGASAGGAVTGADGTFRVEGLVPGRNHLLRVHAAGRALVARPSFTPAAEPYEARLGDVVLGAPHAVRGRVVDAEGRPVARFYVHIAGPDGRGNFVVNDHRLTDDLGRFAFPELPPGRFELDVRTARRREPTEAVVPAVGDADPVVIRLEDEKPAGKAIAYRVPVRVTDEDGRPVAGVKVQVNYVANGVAPTKTTGDDGMVTIDAEFAPADVIVSPDARTWLRQVVHLRPGRTQDAVAVVLRRGALVAGRVVDESGDAVELAWVQAFDGSTPVASMSVGKDGAFAFAVPQGRIVDLQAQMIGRAGDRSLGAAEAWGVAPGAADVVLRLVREPAKRTIDVEVVDETGAPVVGARVMADFTGNDWRKPIGGETATDGHARARDWAKPPKAVTTDEPAGLPDLPRAPILVSVTIDDRAAGFNRSWSPMPRRVAGDVDAVKIVVGKPRRLRGRVVLEDGSPCAGAVVHANPGSGQGSMNVAEADGRFAIDVPADMPTPFVVTGSPFPFDRKKPLDGYDVVDGEERELEIVVRPVPGR